VNQLTGLTREDARKNREESSRNEIFQAKKQELISRGRQDLANRYDRLHDMVASNYSSAMAKAFDESVGFMGAYTEDANKLRMSGNANLQKNLELMEAGQIDEYEVFQRINEDLASTLGEGGIDRGLLQTNDRNFISLADSAKAKALSERKVAEQATKLRDQQRKILGGQGDANTRRYSEMLEAQRDMSAALQDFNDLFDSVFEPIFTSWTDILTVVTKKLTGFVSWMSMDTKYKLLSAIPTIFTGGAIGPNTAAAIIKQNMGDQKPPAPETSTKRETTPAPASAPAEVREPPIATSASDSAIKMIAGFETFQPRAYRDNKQYSIGYGTKTDDPDEIAGRKTITESDAMSRLQSFVNNVTPTVGSMAKKKHWGQNQFDAMVSFTYNLGPGALGQVTENGNRTNQQIANKIPEYNHGEGGKVMPGLTRRRSAEQSLFMTNMPQFAQGGITSGPSIAGEAGPEAVIPLTHGPITVDLGKTADFLSSVQKLVRSDTGAAKYSNDFQPAIAEATEIYQAPNPVEQEILSILRSIGRNSSDLATNNRKIHRAQVN
jgi:GH24 family phage-related lysozyme (muramidase)